jgi:ATP-dependent Lon protease
MSNQIEEQSPEETPEDYEAAFDEYAAADRDEDDEFAEPEPEPEEQEAEEPEQKEEAADQAATDPFAKMTEEELRHRLRSDSGRVGALQRKINDLEGKLRHAQPKEQKMPDKLPQTPKEWEDLREDYPDIASGIEALVESRLKKLDEVSSKVGKFEQESAQRRIEAEMDMLRQAHPDFQEIATSREFDEWVRQQPVSVQAVRKSQSAADAAWMLDLYKRDHLERRSAQAPAKQLQERRKRTLETAQETPTHRRAPAAADESDFEAAWEHYARRRER